MWVLQPFVLRPHDSHIFTCTPRNKGPRERQRGMLERTLPAVQPWQALRPSEPPLAQLFRKWETPLPSLHRVCEGETAYVKAPHSFVPHTE